MEAMLPTQEAILEIESRQDEVLRKLDELEKRVAQTLAQFGDQRFVKSAELGTLRMPGLPDQGSMAKAA